MEGPIYQNLIEKLMKLKLSRDESLALACLALKLPEANAMEICSYTSIPKSKIYDVLDSLEKKSLIIKNIFVYPRTYKKHPDLQKKLEDWANVVYSEMEHEIKNLKKITKDLTAKLYKALGVSTIPTIKEATENAVQMCIEADKGDEIMISTRTFGWMNEARINKKSLLNILEEKLMDGIKISVLLSNPQQLVGEIRKSVERNAEILKHKGIDVGFYDGEMFRMTIVGNKCQFILWYHPFPKPYEKTVEMNDTKAPCNIFYSENEVVVNSCRQLFDYHFSLWKIKERSRVDEEFREKVKKLRDLGGMFNIDLGIC